MKNPTGDSFTYCRYTYYVIDLLFMEPDTVSLRICNAYHSHNRHQVVAMVNKYPAIRSLLIKGSTGFTKDSLLWDMYEGLGIRVKETATRGWYDAVED